jgi:hypothetical protein
MPSLPAILIRSAKDSVHLSHDLAPMDLERHFRDAENESPEGHCPVPTAAENGRHLRTPAVRPRRLRASRFW